MYLSHRKKKQTAIQSLSDADEADRSTETQEGVLVHVSDQKENQNVATMQEEWAGIYKPYNEALGENQSPTSSFNIQKSGIMEQNKTVAKVQKAKGLSCFSKPSKSQREIFQHG